MHKESIMTLRDLIAGSELILFGLMVSIVLVFTNILPNEFVSDDIGSIVQNPKIENLGYLLINGHPTSILFSIMYKFVGLSPWLYHLNSIFWHIAVTILVFFIVHVLSRNKTLAAISAFFFALHPIHAEAVTWISGLPYLLYSFFGLLSFLLFILIDQSLLGTMWIFPSAFFFYLSAISSEKALAFPFLYLLYLFIFSNVRKKIPLILPIFGATALYALKLAGRVGDRITAVNPASEGGTTFFNPLLQISVALSYYFKLLFFPINLTLYHEDLSVNWYQFAICIAITAVFIIISFIFFLKKKRLLFFASAFFFLSLSPTLLPIKISWVVAERYIYLPSIGFILVMAIGLTKLKQYNGKLFWPIFVLLLLGYAFLTIRRNIEWTNQDTLWIATIRESPTSTLALNNIGDYYGRHGDLKRAIAAFSEAIRIRPTYAEATHNLGNAYTISGDATKAALLYQRALELKPDLVESAVNLAAYHAQMNDYEKAEFYLNKALSADPNSPVAIRAQAAYLYQKGQKEEAVRLLRKVLTLYPNNVDAQKSLQFILSEK